MMKALFSATTHQPSSYEREKLATEEEALLPFPRSGSTSPPWLRSRSPSPTPPSSPTLPRCRLRLLFVGPVVLLLLGLATLAVIVTFFHGAPDGRGKKAPFQPTPVDVKLEAAAFPAHLVGVEEVKDELAVRFGLPAEKNLSPLTCEASRNFEAIEERYGYLRESTSPTLVAINLYNSAAVLPSLSSSLIDLCAFLGPGRLTVSVFENGSRDETRRWIGEMGRALDKVGCEAVVRSDSTETKWKDVNRIEQLAVYRNVALEPLQENDFGSVLFINDVFFCLSDALELLHQRIFQNAHATCGLDWMGEATSPIMYDDWVSRALSGAGFRPRIDLTRIRTMSNGVQELFRETRNAEFLGRFEERLPMAVYSCWNGMIALDARPFYGATLSLQQTPLSPSSLTPLSQSVNVQSHGTSGNDDPFNLNIEPTSLDPVRFRAADFEKAECAASECSLVAKDFWRRGFGRFVMVPTVNTAYTLAMRESPIIRSLSSTLFSQIPSREKIDWSVVKPPEKHVSTTVYGSASARTGIPRFELGEEEMDARLAKRFVQDELLMDGSPALNLASFVTTYMEPEAEDLMLSQLSKNFIDSEEYPSCAEIETRCVNIVARLFNAPLDNPDAEALGVSTIGSSEAIILAVLAAKRKWKNKRIAEGKSTDKPNIVMSSAVQVCWEKAARYLEVEEKYWYCRPGQLVMDPEEAAALVDENTILVCAILGTTYTGEYEDIKGINDALAAHNKKHGLDCHIHVDGASGGFVAPFVCPELEWDFRLPLVCSINASGHKYGLTYAGCGWAIFRNKSFLPDEVCFTINYLGAPQISFTLNFSKSAVQVIGQYYQFLRLGKAGYRSIMETLTSTADYLSDTIKAMGDGELFEILSATNGKGLPLVAWNLTKERPYDEFAIASHLRQRGWIVPAYTLPPHAEKQKLLRVVVREDFSRSRCEQFIKDLRATIKYLEEAPAAVATHLSQKPSHVAKSKPSHHDAKHHKNVAHHSLQKHGKTHQIC